jgi:7,8-dihydroneopterin aldolase/epimerase/oxygenase
MINLIKVHGISLKAYHGCMPEERIIGGNYVVNVDIHTDFIKTYESDKLDDTIDYCVINSIVENEMKIPSKLIEHVGYRVYNKIKSTYNIIKKLEVEIVKLSPPIDGNVDKVSIIISD